jgi:hypothetical protein
MNSGQKIDNTKEETTQDMENLRKKERNRIAKQYGRPIQQNRKNKTESQNSKIKW